MSDTRLYITRRGGYDIFDLYMVEYYDNETGGYHTITDVDENGTPVLAVHSFKAGECIKPMLSITGPFFYHKIGRQGLEGFIESLCESFNYVPTAYRAKLRMLDKMINRVAGTISYCARHKTFPKDDEPCWSCMNEFGRIGEEE